MTSVLGTLGQALVLAAMACASAGAVVGFASGRSGSVSGWDWTRRLALGFSACIIAATVVMEVALLNHDFSVRYVAQVGSTQVPAYITVVSLWSALEGSILFWGAVLGLYVAVAVWLNGGRNADSMAYTTGTWMVTGAFFCFLMAGPANPFWPGPTSPMTEGPGPNPLLQNHLLMIVHPPMLYLGYVGMTIPFGIAVGALLRGKLGPGQLSLLRNWLMVAWGFLTVGIVLGGWWAYEVLGWGGYWAWDPVENASFLPWLTATAALHAAMLPSRRGTMQGWTTTLVLVTFLLTILGTFMTRSGVFNSVHAFSQSDIGPTILVFLGAMLVFSVVLLALRLDAMEGEGRVKGALSRESMFLVNNIVLVALTFTVLVGTVYPLLAEAIKGTKVSVGEPFYNQFAVPLGLLLLFLMGVGPSLPWGATRLDDAARRLAPAVGLGLAGVGLGWALGVRDVNPLATCGLAGFALWVTGKELVEPFLGGGDVLDRFRRQRRRWSGYVVHLGIIMMVVGIAMSHAYQEDREVRLTRGASVEFGGYTLTYTRDALLEEPHRSREVAYVEVSRGGRAITTLEPAMNKYDGRDQPIGSPDVHSNIGHDLYASLMMLDRPGGSVALHLFLNPLVYWIWIGTGICTLGALVALLPTGRSAARADAAPEPALQAGK